MHTKRMTMKKATGKKTAAKKPAASKSAKSAAAKKAPGIGRSAITGRFMSVSAAKAHKKTAIVQGAGKKSK
ncbi:MAG TPA: hypothetical protein PLN54_10770 [Flavobacteriales bacterium]|nr:hypothetical protein [Flavobacteriales bacterium]